VSIQPYKHAFYVHLDNFVKHLYGKNNSDLPFPLSNYDKNFVGDEYDSIAFVPGLLERMVKSNITFDYTQGEKFSPRKDLKTIAKWVRWNERSYLEAYSSEKASTIFHQIFYWICRWRMENTSASVQQVIEKFIIEVPSQYSAEKKMNTHENKSLGTSSSKRENKPGCFQVMKKPFAFSEVDSYGQMPVGINHKDLKKIYCTDVVEEGYRYIKIEKRIFTCVESDVEQGKLGFEKPDEVNSSNLNGKRWVFPKPVDPQKFIVKTIFLKAISNSTEACINKIEYKEKLVAQWKNSCLQLGTTYGLKSQEQSEISNTDSSSTDEGISSHEYSEGMDMSYSPVFTVLKMRDSKNKSMQSGFLTDESRIKIFVDQTIFPSFEDEITLDT
jgi:hypothetical protein